MAIAKQTLRPSARATVDSDFDQVAERDLEARVVSMLHARNVPGLQSLEIDTAGATVILRGRLPSPHAKWLCQECCRHVAGVIRLIDEVEVASSAEADPARSAAETKGIKRGRRLG